MFVAIVLAAATIAGLLTLAAFRTTPIDRPAATSHISAPGRPSVYGPTAQTTVRIITGPAVQTMFGPVQVRVKLIGHKIVDAQAIQLPSDYSLSRQISSHAGPLLRQEALTAQNARINSVSGATYTSQGYQNSLQAALDKADL